MNIPEIFSNLGGLSFVNGVYLVIPFLIVGLILALSSRWPISIFAMWGLYFFSGLFISSSIPPHLAFLFWVVGLFTGFILFFTERQKRSASATLPSLLSVLFQLLIVLLIILIGWGLEFFGIFELASLGLDSAARPYAGFIIFLTLGMGLFRFVSSEQALFSGVGILMVLLALVLFQLSISPSKWVLGVWACATLIFALIVSYLSLLEEPISLATPQRSQSF